MTRGTLAAALGGRIAELASQALLLVLLPRLLGARDFGAFAVVQGLVALGSTVAAVGGPVLLSRFVAEAPERERASVARALLTEGIGWRISVLALATFVAAAVAVAFPDQIPPLAVGFGAIALLLTAAGTWASFVALGLGQVSIWSYRYAVQNVATAGAVAAGYAVFAVPGALAGLAVGAAVGLTWASRGVTHVLGAPRVAVPDGWRGSATLVTIGGVAVQLAHRLPIPLVALGAGTVAAGNAAVGLGILLAAIYSVNHPFSVAMPTALARGEGAVRAEAALLGLGARALVVAGGSVLAAVVVAPPLLAVLLGDHFRPAADMLTIGLAAIPLAVATALLGQVATLRLRLRARMVASIAGAIVGLGLCGAVAAPLGADAAAIGLLGWSATMVLVGRLGLPGTGADRMIAASFALSAAVLGLALAGR